VPRKLDYPTINLDPC